MIYKVNQEENSISEITPSKFGDLKIRERAHLQEWIAGNPDVFGEELLIIQKEFDGFNETSERLDLLALDKAGNLIIIENKLDDSGRNVVWQALKYVSYCSTLTTEQILNIYDKYLQNNPTLDIEDATSSIMEFLGIEDEEQLLLNNSDQRIIFVANDFRKEVTSTVLWLLNHDIQIQCFRAVPFSYGNDILLQFEQIIPLPETESFMIEIKEKEKEKKAKGDKHSETNKLLIDFWSKFQEDLKKNKIHWLDSVSVRPRWYTGFGRGAGSFNFCFGRNEVRVELYFPHDPEKKHFDILSQKKDLISEQLEGITWERLNSKKAARIKLSANANVFLGKSIYNKDDHDSYINWFRESMNKFHKVMLPHLERTLSEVKRTS